jgi:hypothetical protein
MRRFRCNFDTTLHSITRVFYIPIIYRFTPEAVKSKKIRGKVKTCLEKQRHFVDVTSLPCPR